MIKPTVGRVVWYHPSSSSPEGQPHAAIVSHVWSDTCVNLAVFDANGVAYSVTSVLLHQEGSEKPYSCYAEWMPYQIKVAKNPEEAVFEGQIDKMVDRFLGWKIPKDFCPDAGISFEAEYNVDYMASRGKPPIRHEPVGTNLFTADQAREMIKYMLEST